MPRKMRSIPWFDPSITGHLAFRSAIGTGPIEMRSLVDGADLPVKLQVEQPNHRVPLGDGPILHSECEGG